MKRYLALALLLVLFSCSTNKKPEPTLVTFPDAEVPTITDVMAPAKRFVIEPSMEKYTSLSIRAEKFFSVIAKDSSLIPKTTYSNTQDTRDIVISKIRASEGEIVVPVDMYWPNMFQTNRVTAYRVGNRIRFNGNRMNRGDCALINTFVHEWLHALGYDHKSAKDLMSVPYYYGDMAEEACKNGKI